MSVERMAGLDSRELVIGLVKGELLRSRDQEEKAEISLAVAMAVRDVYASRDLPCPGEHGVGMSVGEYEKTLHDAQYRAARWADALALLTEGLPAVVYDSCK